MANKDFDGKEIWSWVRVHYDSGVRSLKQYNQGRILYDNQSKELFKLFDVSPIPFSPESLTYLRH